MEEHASDRIYKKGNEKNDPPIKKKKKKTSYIRVYRHIWFKDRFLKRCIGERKGIFISK